MKTRFTWLGIIAACILTLTALFIGCNGDLKDVVLYRGQVVYINTTTPFADLTVKVTDGQNTHCQTQTDAGGNFSLKVRVNEIDGSYYLLAGDETCVPKKVSLGGYGQAEVDLGVIEVEGPALPTVKTDSIKIEEVTADGAIIRGEVLTDGRLAVTARGVCYGTIPDPIIDGLHTTEGSGLGTFTSTLKDLEHNTIYYARAYATNKMGTAYGEQVKFTTELGVPIVITDSVIRITAHSAKCKGHVESDGGYAVSKKGTCWSRQPDPTVDDECTNDGSGKGEFTSTLSGLLENTTYYVRTYATNATATVYGEQIIITTLDGFAVVKTDSVNNIAATGFTAFGTVVSDCDIPVIERGFCYSTSQYPTIGDSHIASGKGLGDYKSNITKLEYGTTYYVRAYATNETGTTYGDQVEITTLSGLPTVTTDSVSNIGSVKATCGGNVTDDGTLTVTARGVCYGTEPQPTIEDTHTTDGKGTGKFVSNLKNLSDKTTYYIRAYATTAAGTAYGEQRTFKTENGIPVVLLSEVGEPTANSVTCKGNVTGDGGVTITERGFCYGFTQYPTNKDAHIAIGNGVGEFSGSITKLNINTTYYVRAYAVNSLGIGYSEQKSFTTKNGLPTVTTSEPSATATTITVGGNITDNGGYAVSDRGVCYSASNSEPTITEEKVSGGKGNGEFSVTITKLVANTTYHLRAYATNENGTTYGKSVTIKTKDGNASVSLGEITDITALTASASVTVTDAGSATLLACGICWSTNPNPTIDNNKTEADGKSLNTAYKCNLSGLTANQKYYVRAYATTEATTTYSEQKTFTTVAGLASVTTGTATSTSTAITCNGEVTGDSGYSVTERGMCYSQTNAEPTITDAKVAGGSGKGAFSVTISKLTPATSYYVRAYATNVNGTAYGKTVTIKTTDGKASVSTAPVTNITALTATGGVTVGDLGGATLISCGICWATTQNPTITDSKKEGGKTAGTYSCNMSNLTPNTTYYVRAYATTDVTTVYGSQEAFTTATGLPVLTTTNPTATSTTITTGGNITSNGGYAITARGVCWSTTNSNPDLKDKLTNDGKGIGTFTSSIAELTPNTTYYVRAYATNQIGTAYGSAITIKTKDGKAGITTTNITNITALTATGGGKVTDAGGATIKAVGICWATTQNPAIAGSHTTDGNSLGSFTSNITGLKANTTYYVRAYCTTDVTTNYGDQVSFTTKNGAAAVTTEAVTNIKAFTATGGVTVTDAGGATLKSCGICWSSNPNPTIENNKSVGGNQLNTTYSLNITDLTPDTKYYVRAYATTDITTAYGKELSFLTTKGTPEVTLAASTKVLTKSFVANANITSDGGYSVTARGFCWSNTKGTPTISDSHVEAGSGMGAFSQTITNLEANTTYYIRAYATNSMGTIYSDVITQRTGNGLQGVYFDSNPVSNIKAGSAVCKVSVDYKYSDVPIISEGVCWSSISSTPTINDAKTNDGQATTTFNSTLTNLSPTTTYYVRAYITTSYGTSYSPTSASFTTTDGLPKVTTKDITTANVTPSSFTCGGEITEEGDAPVTARGICWNTTGTPTISDSHSNSGTGKGSFTHTITGVSTHTQTYYVRAYATNKYGTSYGEVVVQNKNNPYKLPTVTLDNTTYMIYPTDLGEMTWTQANSTCTNLNAYGFDDWRLPSEAECILFYNYKAAYTLFTSGTRYWTSTYFGRVVTNYDTNPWTEEDAYQTYTINHSGVNYTYAISRKCNVRPIRIMIE